MQRETVHQWDREWLESMYNNQANVSDSAVHIKNWSINSAKAREDLLAQKQACLDIRYGVAKQETLDIFLPAQRNKNKPAPVFVFIHGGYWQALDKNDLSFIAPSLTQQGACTVILNYTLCPEITVSGIVDEITRAIIWLKLNIADYGGDPESMTLAGHSAGGHLTAMMFTRDWQRLMSQQSRSLPSTYFPFKNGLSISGLYDLAPLSYTPFLEKVNISATDIVNASPAHLSCSSESGCLYSVVGGDESKEFLRQNCLIQQQWGKSIVPLCQSLIGLNHFSIVEALIDPNHDLNTLALSLLDIK